MTTTPIPPDWRGLCEELLEAWDAQPLPPYQSSWAGVISRTRRALLAQPEHEVASPTQDELWELWLRLDRELPDRPAAVAAFWEHAQVEARARCGRPAPAPAGEVGELVAALLQVSDGASACGDEGTSWITARAADLLERQAVPVAVSERPWEREGWCNEKGECWGNWLRTWKVCNPRILDPKSSVLLLPFNSLPLPSREVE